MKIFLLISIIFGLSALVMDAFIAHGLEAFLGQKYDATVHHAMATAARYQLIFAIFLCVQSFIFRTFPNIWLLFSQCLIVLGITLFSGTIYLQYVMNSTFLSFLAPIGGVSLMLSFLALLPLLLLL